MEKEAFENDREIRRIVIEKFPIKKGQLGDIQIFGEVLQDELQWKK